MAYRAVLEQLVARGRGGGGGTVIGSHPPGLTYKNMPSLLGLNRTRNLLQHVLSDDAIDVLGKNAIHVVGTNGKGSVAWMSANTLHQSQQCKNVGLYTSPHLFSVRERIRLNGEMIGEAEFTRLGAELLDVDKDRHCSYFELVTIMALTYFARKQCDAIVLEAGMGGKGDATNVLSSSRVAVLTSVAFDHVAVLGPTLEHICKEKIGIVKPGSKVVIGQSVPVSLDPIINDVCVTNQASSVKRLFKTTEDVVSFDDENKHTVTVVVEEFLSGSMVSLNDSKPRCRFEVVIDPISKKQVILDVGHNPSAIRALMNQLSLREFHVEKGGVVFGLAADKDADKCIEALCSEKKWKEIRLVQLKDGSRKFASHETLMSLASKRCTDKTSIQSNLEMDGAIRGLLIDPKIAYVLVCGSHSLMRLALEAIGHSVKDVDPIDTNERGARDT